MLVKMIHPNGQNTKMCDPQQKKRLLKLGWTPEQTEPLADVVEFQNPPIKTASEITEFVKKCECKTECPAPVEQVTPEPEPEPQAEEPVKEMPVKQRKPRRK